MPENFNVVITMGSDEYFPGEKGNLGVTNARSDKEGQDLALLRYQFS